MIQRLKVQIPVGVRGFFIFKNFLRKLQIGNKYLLKNNYYNKGEQFMRC